MRLAIFVVGLCVLFGGPAPPVRAQDALQNTSTSQSFGPEIQFDTKGVEFGPWIRGFIAQVKRNWFLPAAAIFEKGHVVVTFDIRKDGAITNVKIDAASAVAAFNDSARTAILNSNPTRPLPQEYPATHAHFTVTFYYSESPPSTARSSVVTAESGLNPSSRDTTASTNADPQFRADIQRLMDVTGVKRIATQLSNLMVDALRNGLKRTEPNIPDRAIAIIKEVISAEVAREMSAQGGIQEQVVDLYARYFTHEEITALLAFYATPVEQKALTATPRMLQEAVALGQNWAQSNSLRMMSVLQERLRAEGLIR